MVLEGKKSWVEPEASVLIADIYNAENADMK
jgi:hypothetical protein